MEEAKYNKVVSTTFDLGGGDYVGVAKMHDRYMCWGEFRDKGISLDCKTDNYENEILTKMEEVERDLANSLMKAQETILRMKEDGMRKTAEKLGKVIEREK